MGAVVGAFFVAQPALADTTDAPSPEDAVLAQQWDAPENANTTVEGSAPTDTEIWQSADGSRALSGDTAKTGGQAQRVTGTVTVGAPGIGALPYFSLQDFPLWDDTTARVNIANGNLLVGANDSRINGAGVGTRVDRFYNGLGSVDGAFGGGWTLGTGQDTGLVITASTITVQGANGFKTAFTSDGSGGWTPPAGFAATMRKSGTQWVLQYNKSGEKLVFSAGGYLAKDTDRNNTGLSLAYTSNKLTTISDAAGRTNTFAYTGAFINTLNDAGSRQTTYARDSSNRLVTITAPDGAVASYTYDTTGRLSTITGPDGAGVTTFTYDTSHRVTKLTQTVTSTTGGAKADKVTSFTYSAGKTIVKDARGNSSTFTLDTQGRVTIAKDQLGNERSQTWNTNSNVQSSTSAFASDSTAGNSTTYDYDALNNATQISLPTGAAASAQYAVDPKCPTAGSGNPNLPKCSQDSAGNSKSMQYDTAGNLTSVKDTTSGGTGATVQQTAYENSAGTICSAKTGQVCSTTNGNNKTTTYAYNADGEVASITAPAPLGVTSYTYDSLSRVKTTTDGTGQTNTYLYDAADRLIETAFPTSRTFDKTGAVYKDNGAVTKTIDITQEPYSNQVKEVSTSTFYDYDTLGQLMKKEYDTTATRYLTPCCGGGGSARAAAVTPVDVPATPKYVMTFTYDAGGNISQLVDPSGTTVYAYDAANQVAKVKEPGGTCPTTGTAPAANSGCITFAYDGNGSEITRTYPGGTTKATSYDNSGRTKRITTKTAGASTLADIGYSYTATDGSDQTMIQARTSYKEVGITANATTNYTYDSLGRVTQAQEKVGSTVSASWVYGYDKAGNRTSQTRAGSTGATAGTLTYTYNAANELTSATGDTNSWTYNGVGDQTKNGATGDTSIISTRGQVNNIGATDFAYVGAGNADLTNAEGDDYYSSPLGATGQKNGARTLSFTRAPSGEILGERSTAAPTQYFSTDLIGSVSGLLSPSGAFVGGYSYSPYGETRSSTNNASTTANTVRYIGMNKTAGVDTYKLGARYYDSTIGRFSQQDPSGQESNPFAYASSNPINLADPTGYLGAEQVVSILDALLTGKDVYDLFSADSTAEGISAEFAIACGLIAGAIAAPTVAGTLVAIGGCAVAGVLLDNALADEGIA